ncbi:MAG TPA: 1,2-phenylacetyl-CoA epoxidase subunit PaaC, partial [Marmoricola sp.]|nr:1,2-phenylacetyl-CoA epoxidase subunit PaaC [Marmoricola sp.]
LALADDALVAAQRLTEWVARAPEIEEDVAIANIGLDLLGQARLLLSRAGARMTPPRTEDDLAYFRDEREFRNAQLVERPIADFAVLIVRLLLLSGYQLERYRGLLDSRDATVAAVAAKAVKEVAYHRDHARTWTLRLGDGTTESRRRMVAALEGEWPYLAELLADLADPDAALGWITGVLDEAGLAVPDVRDAVTGGRSGVHTEAMGYLLAELQHLARSHPGATW